jgi:hypothetical protein
MNCPKCNKEYDEGFKFCPFCGQKKPIEPEKAEEVRAEPPSPPGVTPVSPPVTPKRPVIGPPPLPQTPPMSPVRKKAISERWQGLSNRGKAIVVGVGVLLLIVIIVAAITSGGKKTTVNVGEKEETSVTTTSESQQEQPTKTADDFISITNVRDGQELTVGPSVIAGTAQGDECTITCNGQPVGFVPGTKNFEPTLQIAEGPNTVTFVVTDKDNNTFTKTLNVTGVLSPDTYKAVSPDGPDFAHLNKNPDGYAGTRCKYKGKVVQVMESGGTTDIRMDITPAGYGVWTDTIYVNFIGTTPAVEESIIVVYGTIKGGYTYTSQANYKITLPLIEAKYIDVVQ